MKGPPIKAVHTLIGILKLNISAEEMISLTKAIAAPRMALTNSINLKLTVLINNLETFGMAMPIKAIGPQNAVAIPLSIPVHIRS